MRIVEHWEARLVKIMAARLVAAMESEPERGSVGSIAANATLGFDGVRPAAVAWIKCQPATGAGCLLASKPGEHSSSSFSAFTQAR